jgi:lipopolysaccharide export system permease protein
MLGNRESGIENRIMKLLDRYVAKNFIIGYVIAFGVLMGLRTITDLFVNLDEFTEHADMTTREVVKNVLTFYCFNWTLYFRDFAGMITAVAAAFSFGRMVRSNELVAIMASGISLKRIIAPIVFLALLLTGVLIIDQELLIPPLADKLVRSHDDLPGQESYDVRFIDDSKESLINSQKFDVGTLTLHNPTILLRQRNAESRILEVTGRITAEKAVYNKQTGAWDLWSQDSKTNELVPYGVLEKVGVLAVPEKVPFYKSDITAKDIPIRRKSEHKSLLSFRYLTILERQETGIRDRFQLSSQKHFRITDPIINLVMLMVSLPILVCRDPKAMKSAVMISFGITAACFVTTFVCKMLATEVVFDKVMPALWAWLPVFIFLPIAFIELDSMKT